MQHRFLLIILVFIIGGCASVKKGYEAVPYDFPNPVDTNTKTIELQEKRAYLFENSNIGADNQFDGARLNDFQRLNENSYVAIIKPENIPINPSPWYAFRIWSQDQKKLNITLKYENAKHRYTPKLSVDGISWHRMDPESITFNNDSTEAYFEVEVDSDTLWISAQEIINSGNVRSWCGKMAEQKNIAFNIIGKSRLNRDIYSLFVSNGSKKKKDLIAIISRQHPPEVTGYMAMESFVERIVNGDQLSKDFLQKYNILVYPLLNPDGVDLGHWRHNAGGVDLNRDWAYYRQPEIKQIADHMVSTSKRLKNRIIFGMDFHSTYWDVYYTLDDSLVSHLPGFKDQWLEAIEREIANYEINDHPSGLGAPVSKSWFFTQFQAEGVTYEIGDNTPRAFIKKKGAISATKMMEILLGNQ
ncbi:M14 family metallopeptidase [Fulvivirgaceae bacterium BMA10]|uniref:M14 family metallopeptidase n=1 Tax=Splendidivirga corallicola TaxID=3051826 RepID=A0ABT8KKA8_9BACT|nr:M14 family metallopeptidase [Fulvivirgaceae bacterium BMA10]